MPDLDDCYTLRLGERGEAPNGSRPILLFVDNNEICEDFSTTAHRISSVRIQEVVLWRGRYYDDEDEFVSDWVDCRYDPSMSVTEVEQLEIEAGRLWFNHSVECVVCTTAAALLKSCEIDD